MVISPSTVTNMITGPTRATAITAITAVIRTVLEAILTVR